MPTQKEEWAWEAEQQRIKDAAAWLHAAAASDEIRQSYLTSRLSGWLIPFVVAAAILFGIGFGIRACVFNEIANNQKACEAVNGVWVEQNNAPDRCKYLRHISTPEEA